MYILYSFSNILTFEWADLRSIQQYWQGQKANSRIYTHSSSSNIIKPNNTSNLSVRLPVLKKKLNPIFLFKKW
jgi:hypothetical protein